jgi:hypothetical protein
MKWRRNHTLGFPQVLEMYFNNGEVFQLCIFGINLDISKCHSQFYVVFTILEFLNSADDFDTSVELA